MEHWAARLQPELDLSWPCWEDYRPALMKLMGSEFPQPHDLCGLLPDDLASHGGSAVRFVPAEDIPDVSYEDHIYRTGQVSTRSENWHDLFNALVWSQFPHLKSAMNAVHFRQQQKQCGSQRGKLRDALTLMDESGAIVVSHDKTALEAVARHEWDRVFSTGFAESWEDHDTGELKIFLCGHALLEKFLDPYKAITAKVLLVEVDQSVFALPRHVLLSMLDQSLAEGLLKGRLISAPADLAPLPLMGIPGWWPGHQDATFYADSNVFRPPGKTSPATITRLRISYGAGKRIPSA